MSSILNNQQLMLFQQVDNSSLDRMNHNLWNNLPFGPDNSIRSLFNDDPFYTESSTANKDTINSGSPELSSRPALIQSPTSSTNTNGVNNSGDEQQQDSRSNTMITMRGDSNFGLMDNGSNSPMCTLYIDMTFDDRVFFGVYNSYILRCSFWENQCNVDLSAPNNKVSIMGSVVNVGRMYRSVFAHSTLALQFNFRYYCKATFQEFLDGSFRQFQKENEELDVCITYRLYQENVMTFNFLTFKKLFVLLARIIRDLQMQLQFYQLGEVIPEIMSTLQIPLMRRDFQGNNNAYIETIEKQTNTRIRTKRCTECHGYPFENVIITGKGIFAVVQAHIFLTGRLEHELKFQVPTNDIGLLVRTVSNLSYDKSAFDVTISPTSNCLEMKIISIKSVKQNVEKIFNLRQELLHTINGRSILGNQ